jgi:hypothetical protein
MDVGLIYTAEGSPESKGKVEKSFDYLQRRIPYLCERHNVRDLVEAGKIVTDVVGFYNEERVHLETEEVPRKRWDEALRAGRGKLRPLDPSRNLDLIFSLHYERTMKKDGTFRFQGREYKLRHLAGTRVTIGLIPKTKLLVIKDGQRAAEFPL